MSERVPMSDAQEFGLPVRPSAPRVKDPVCGMWVDSQNPAGKVEHGGRAYYFCSSRCAERFEKEPEKFIAAPGTAGMEQRPAPPSHGTHPQAAAPVRGVSSSARYTWPMHPEIVQTHPGTCPNVAMPLEPIDVFADVKPVPEFDHMR